jgi:hypothetical protein
MKTMKSWVLAAGVLLGAAGAMAQQGAGTRPGPIVPPGSGMGGGMGAGPGMGPGMGAAAPAAAGGARWGADDTPGWSMMSEPERNAHQDRMRAMKTYEECKAYADQHHEQMSARAKERGGQALAQAPRDPCGRLKR